MYRTSFFLVISAVIAVLSGCSGHSYEPSDSIVMKQAMHESEMITAWQGKTYEELVEAKGKETMRMSVPGQSLAGDFVVIYGTDTQSGCLDAFRIVNGKQLEIKDYFCR